MNNAKLKIHVKKDDLLREEQKKNEILQSELNKTKAKLDYVAMMTDVVISDNTEGEGGNNNG
jgi:hypothetical protein